MVNHRTAVVSQIRGLLLDRGIAFPKSNTRARRMIPETLADEENELTALAREAIGELHDLFRDLDRRIASFDKKIDRVFRSSEDCQRIARIKGVGPKTATAVIAAIATARNSGTGATSPPGSTSFTSGVASTVPRLPSPTRTHGSSGPCFEVARPTTPPAEDPPPGCETMEK